MFKTLILKEIRETLHNFRFLIATLLCLVLIPLGMYVTLKEYEQRFSDYQDSVRLYQERSEGNIGDMFPAEGYRPPSVFSVFSLGLEYFLPNKVVTSRDGQFRLSNESGINNPESLLFGKVDFLFNASFVLSLLVLIFTFSSITGEKEMGTLRLIISNSIPRWKILWAKISGNFLVFLAPFIISFLIGVLILNFSGVVNVFSGDVFPILLVILFVTILFLFSMLNLGILVSTFTHHSIISMITILFLWVILALAVPKVSPMVAQILYPVKSQQVVNTEKQIVYKNLEDELDQKRRELLERILYNSGLSPNNIPLEQMGTPEFQKALEQYDKEKISLEDEYNNRINTSIRMIEQNYANKKNTQSAISKNLSRISPVSCFTYIISEISGTGILEISNFQENAERFQDKVKREIYDNLIIKSYGFAGMSMLSTENAEGFDPENISVPHMSDYTYTSLEDALRAEWVDIVLLALFSILFFACSFVSFIRYDVR